MGYGRSQLCSTVSSAGVYRAPHAITCRVHTNRAHIGHAGHDTVDYTLEFLPDAIKSALETLLSVSPSPSAESVSTLLAKCIESFDDSITAALFSLFPGGEESIKKMSNDQIKAIINDGGKSGVNAAILSHCMRGTTALVALVDPQKANIWVASLGDCVAGMYISYPVGYCIPNCLFCRLFSSRYN